MPDLLLELFSEEIPARMQRRAAEDLKKLVADILDRVDLHEDFDPRRHYTLTLAESEMSVVERAAASATSVDDIELS